MENSWKWKRFHFHFRAEMEWKWKLFGNGFPSLLVTNPNPYPNPTPTVIWLLCLSASMATHECRYCLRKTIQDADEVNTPFVLPTSRCNSEGGDGRHFWQPLAVAPPCNDYSDLNYVNISLCYDYCARYGSLSWISTPASSTAVYHMSLHESSHHQYHESHISTVDRRRFHLCTPIYSSPRACGLGGRHHRPTLKTQPWWIWAYSSLHMLIGHMK